MKYRKNTLRNLKIRLLAVFTIIAVLILVFIYFSEIILRPILKEYTQNQAQKTVHDIVNNSVYELLEEQGLSYSDIALITRDDSSNVSSLEVDIVKINSIKSGITKAITDNMKSVGEITVSIPFGTLTGSKYLLGRGPKIPFKMQLGVAVQTDFESNFSDAGINQTLHQIIINVDCKVYAIMPPFNTSCDVNTGFIAAQSVIVGMVPDSYTSVFEGEPSDITDAIFDYADNDIASIGE